MNLDGLLGRHLVIPSRLARLQFIKGFTPPHLPSYAIHSSIIRPRPGMSLMLDRARFKIVFFCPRFDLTLDGFSRPEANSLVFEFTFERDLLVAVHARPTYIFTPRSNSKPKFLHTDASLLEVFFVGNFPAFEHSLYSLCPAFARFCWLSVGKKLRPPQSRFTRHL